MKNMKLNQMRQDASKPVATNYNTEALTTEKTPLAHPPSQDNAPPGIPPEGQFATAARLAKKNAVKAGEKRKQTEPSSTKIINIKGNKKKGAGVTTPIKTPEPPHIPMDETEEGTVEVRDASDNGAEPPEFSPHVHGNENFQKSKTYVFHRDYPNEFGLVGAILIHQIAWACREKKSQNRPAWHLASVEYCRKRHPYLTRGKIKAALACLVDRNVLSWHQPLKNFWRWSKAYSFVDEEKFLSEPEGSNMIRYDTGDAEKHGIIEACIIHNFAYWLQKNKAQERPTFKGRTWHYASASKLSRFFGIPKSERGVERALKSLVDKGVLLRERLHKNKHVRGFHYAFVDEEGYHRPYSTEGADLLDQYQALEAEEAEIEVDSQDSFSEEGGAKNSKGGS